MANEIQNCPICGRSLILGPSVNEHHLRPKCKGGRNTTLMHRICHRKIHSLFSESELSKTYNTPDVLLAHEEIQKFVAWVARKPPEFYDGSATANRKRKR